LKFVQFFQRGFNDAGEGKETRMARKDGPHIDVVGRLDQIQTLASAVRQEIMDTLQASGPLTVRQLARLLGRPPDSLYYHLKKLIAVDLVREKEESKSDGGGEAKFELPFGLWQIHYDVGDPESISAMARVVSTLLRVTDRDYRRALAYEEIVPHGPDRNVWGGRSVGWVTEHELVIINAKIQQILEILKKRQRPENSRLVAFTHAITLLHPGQEPGTE
jgi:DNA-binding transcriptional ArsR family regulator